MTAKASLFSESVEFQRLFLISSNEVNKPIPVIDKQGNGIAGGSNKLKRTTNRKRVIFDGMITRYGKTYQINNGKGEKKLGLYVETLQRIIEQFEIALTKWKRVFVLRFDLHIPFETKDNKHMTAFRKRLFQKLKREYSFKEVGFCWAREYHGKGKGQHYHWVLFLDGNLIRHSSRINEMVRQAWEMPVGGFHVPTIKRPFYFADSDAIAIKAIYRISYLAKTRGKGYRPAQTKDYQCSRMKLPE
ncbi:MAG: inovirus-type Gp2 protein [Methylophaga sp.]|nr:inovirus-type Gp2 protein [Methylophaga sp.]